MGLSQASLAGLVDSSNQQISRLERGERQFTERWRERLAPHLHIQPDDLKPGTPLISFIKREAIALIVGMNDDQVQRWMPFASEAEKLVKSSESS